MKKFADLLRQRGAARNRQTQFSSQARLNFGKDQCAGQRMGDAENPGNGQTVSPAPADPAPYRYRPAEKKPLESAASGQSGSNPAVGVLIDSRNGEEQRGTNDQQILGDRFQRAGKAAGIAFRDHHEMLQPPERMGEGQKLERDILLRRRQTIQRPLLPLAVAPPLLLEIVESEDPGMLQPVGNGSAGRIYHDNLLQLSQGRIAGSQLAKSLKRLYQQHGAFRMLEDMSDLGRGARVIDRHRQGA